MSIETEISFTDPESLGKRTSGVGEANKEYANSSKANS